MSAEVRAQAIGPEGSFLVQAPAGSGKTELLTRRILALLAVVDEPEEILALTFTRKAAAEMRGRVVEALRMAEPADAGSHRYETWRLACAANARSDERGWHLADHPARLRMMTLDSFTHALARQLPLLSGLGEMPSPVEHVAPLYRQAAEAAVNRLLRRDEAVATRLLLHQDHNLVALRDLLADMLGKRDQWLPEVARHARDPQGLRTMLESGLAEIVIQRLEACMALVPLEIRQTMPALLRMAGETLGHDGLSEIRAWPAADTGGLAAWQMIADLILTRTGASIRKRVDAAMGFPAGKAFSAAKQQMKEMLDTLADIDGLGEALHGVRCLPASPHFDDDQWQVLEGQLMLLIMAYEGLQGVFAEQGVADYTEIALRAMRALEDEAGRPTDLLLRLDYRIRHILVDEFQDTSLLQFRLLRNLTEGWQAGDGTHRTLFMVGDPMQSIYRFRKAEVALFLQAAANDAGLPWVEPLKLERNFRSSPAIVDWVNDAFSTIFPTEDLLMSAVGHAPAVPAREHAGEVRLHLQQERDASAEAEAVLATVREALAVEGRRIGILARSRRHLHGVMAALAEAGVAFRAVDILPLNERAEIRLLRALLRALLHPMDRESWTALLRAPCCGLDTGALHELLLGGQADGDRAVWEILADEACIGRLEADAARRVRHLVTALAPCLAMAGHARVRTMLDAAWDRLGMPGLLDAAAQRNVQTLLELIDGMEEGGHVDFALLDDRLTKLYAAPDPSAEAARVELLTMHGAKGLQWDTVILPGLGHGKGRSNAPLLAFSEIPLGGGAVCPLISVKGAVRSSDAVYNLLLDVENIRENNELTRLLYVACTRAETSLHMFGHVSGKDGTATKGSLLSLLLPGGEEDGCFGAAVDWIDVAAGDAEHEVQIHEAARLTRIRQVPVLADVSPPMPAEGESEYFWAGVEAAPVGTAVHAALQHVGESGVEHWDEDATQGESMRMRRCLVAAGLSGESLEAALARSVAALARVLESERGCWLLSGAHEDAHCEWALSGVHDGSVSHHVIDRSFVDAEGVRWIVDYKTASHEGGAIDTFLREEALRHGPQLSRYAQLLGRMEPGRRLRTALYFPMLDAWVEVAAS